MRARLVFLVAICVVASSCAGDAQTTTADQATEATSRAADPGSITDQLFEQVTNERWDADCIALLDDALEQAQNVVDFADPLTTTELADQSTELTRTFLPIQTDLAARFETLACSQFWWDINLVDRADTLASTSVAGFATKFGFLETSISNISLEYGAVVGRAVDRTPGADPQRPEPNPAMSSCQDVYDALLSFQRYQVDLADHLATLPATPPDGYTDYASRFAATTESASDSLGCDAVSAAEHIIENEAELGADNFYGRFAKYLAFLRLLRQADF